MLKLRRLLLSLKVKSVPTIDDAANILRLLARSATGQDIASYIAFSMGPRRPADCGWRTISCHLSG